MATNESVKDQSLLSDGHHDDLLQDGGGCSGDEEEDDEAKEGCELQGKQQFFDNNNRKKLLSTSVKSEPIQRGGDNVDDQYDGRDVDGPVENQDHNEVQLDEKQNNNNKYENEVKSEGNLSPSNSDHSSAISKDQVKKETVDEDEDLEEGELKDDEDDEDDEDVVGNNSEEQNRRRLNTGYNSNNNNSGITKEPSSFNTKGNRHDQQINYPPNHHLYHPNRRHQQQLSPNSQAEMLGHQQMYPSNHPPPMPQHHFSHSNNNSNNHYRYPPNDGPPYPPLAPHHINHQQGPLPPGGAMYPRGGPGNVGPMHKVNVRCRFYSKNGNKCTWGDQCRFEHRDDSPNPTDFDVRPPQGAPQGTSSASSRGPNVSAPMGAAERNPPVYPPYGAGRHHQPPYPSPQTYGSGYPSPYDGYGHPHQHHSTSPPLPLPPHQQQQWSRHSPYPSPSSSSATAPIAHPPESESPALQTTSGGPTSANAARPSQAACSSGGSGSSGGGTGSGQPPAAGASSPSGANYPSPSSSSAVVYERKHRLAYELAPWNDRGGGYPPSMSKYDRGGDPGPYPPASRGFYRSHHYSGSREPPPYGREPYMPGSHMGAPYPGYNPAYPSGYRGGSQGPHSSHHHYPHHQPYSKFNNMSSSQRIVPPDSRRSRKRGHDEDESSWSDSGSDDSILGQAKNYGGGGRGSHTSKHITSANRSGSSSNKHHQASTENLNSLEEPLEEQGSGTPPGEPLPEDRERQEMLLNKLKEIEDLMAKKKGEQEDPM